METRAGQVTAGRGDQRPAIRSWRGAADDALVDAARGGAAYDRVRILPRLIAFDPAELRRDGPALDAAIMARLERALRAERRRGAAGRWTYDLNRHLALVQALVAERRRRRPPHT